MKINEKLNWDVSLEENDRTILPANDCRRFNGGEVAQNTVTQFWPKEGEEPSKPVILTIKVIDRLRP